MRRYRSKTKAKEIDQEMTMYLIVFILLGVLVGSQILAFL
jgi:hypothetical protein